MLRRSTLALKSRASTSLAWLWPSHIYNETHCGASSSVHCCIVYSCSKARQLLPAEPVCGCSRWARVPPLPAAGRGRCWGLAPWRVRAGGPPPRPARSLTRAAALPRHAWAGGPSIHPATPWGFCRRHTARRAPEAPPALGHGRAAPAGKASQPAGLPGTAPWSRRCPKGQVRSLPGSLSVSFCYLCSGRVRKSC